MKRGGQNLFSYFKPTSSPAASNGRQSPKLVTPQRPATPKGGKSGGRKKQKSSTPSAPNRTPKTAVNGEQIDNGGQLNLEPVSQTSFPETEEEGGRGRAEEKMEATPTPSSRKRPHPLESDDSEEEIGVRKTPSGRPKRLASMTSRERQRMKKRPKRALDSDDSGTSPLTPHPSPPPPLTSPPPLTEEEYRPGSSASMDSDSCSSGEEEKEIEEEEEEEEVEEEEDTEEERFVTPAKKVSS